MRGTLNSKFSVRLIEQLIALILGIPSSAYHVSKPSAVTKHKDKKKTNKRNTGTCYLQSGYRNVLARDVTKTQCKKTGGKSWRKAGGTCEQFEQRDL